MATQKHRYTRIGGFSGAKAYIWYVEYRKKCHDAVDRSFYDAIKQTGIPQLMIWSVGHRNHLV
jgi:hypothetical protein